MRATSRIAVLACLSAGFCFAQDQDFSKVQIKVSKVAGSVYMLVGAGGNIGASVGDDGIVIVDDQYAPLADKIQAALKGITDKPVRFIINTHYHGDHTGGNEFFQKQAPIIAHDNVRKRLEEGGQKQASWRTDPKRSGAAGSFGDIGTHAYNLGRFITGLLPEQVSCLLRTYVPGRQLDDYGVAAIRFDNGALGTVTASQISHGRENDLWIEIDGTRGSLEWHQEDPNRMIFRRNGQPQAIYTRAGGPYLGETAARSTRIPSGHPEGYLEAFANIYVAAYDDMAKRAVGQKFDYAHSLYPNVNDGVDGMNFVEKCVASSKENGHWLPLKHPLCRS